MTSLWLIQPPELAVDPKFAAWSAENGTKLYAAVGAKLADGQLFQVPLLASPTASVESILGRVALALAVLSNLIDGKPAIPPAATSS